MTKKHFIALADSMALPPGAPLGDDASRDLDDIFSLLRPAAKRPRAAQTSAVPARAGSPTPRPSPTVEPARSRQPADVLLTLSREDTPLDEDEGTLCDAATAAAPTLFGDHVPSIISAMFPASRPDAVSMWRGNIDR